MHSAEYQTEIHWVDRVIYLSSLDPPAETLVWDGQDFSTDSFTALVGHVQQAMHGKLALAAFLRRSEEDRSGASRDAVGDAADCVYHNVEWVGAE